MKAALSASAWPMVRGKPSKVAVGAIGAGKALAHQVDDDRVRDQLPGLDDLLGGQAERGARLDRGAQHVARGNLGDPESLDEKRGLGTLARSRRSYEHNESSGIGRSALRQPLQRQRSRKQRRESPAVCNRKDAYPKQHR